jgi:hypothetical protein
MCARATAKASARATGLALLLMAALLGSGAEAANEPILRRFALIVSANDGGPGRPTLRYADSDARAVSEVLRSLGGLRDEDTVLLPAVTRASLQAGFDRLKQALAGAAGGRARRELFVYYSGHSNEEGLLLGREQVAYDELRRWIADTDADVRIAILDSCASGALIRQKGGSRRASFLHDASTAARGHAFLTASAADEAAQESDRIGGAFFTHFLVSGLRGAADTSRDGRVTLSEAYNFAYQETLFRTERTVGGPQHANYDIQMAGTGDLLVMTDLRATGAGLLIDESVAGRLYVRDGNGRLLVELRKEPLYPVELGLGPGRYRVFLDADGRDVDCRTLKGSRTPRDELRAAEPRCAHALEASVVLENGKTARLGRAQFVAAGSVVATARGDGSQADLSASLGPIHTVPFELVLAPTARTGARPNERVLNNFVLGLVGHSHLLRGLQLSLATNEVAEDMSGMQVSVGYNRVRGPARGLQVASGVNVVDRSLHGMQVASFANVLGGDLRGLQTGLANHAAGQVRGAQVGVVSHAGGDLRGLQVGVGTWARGQIYGLQTGVLAGAGSVRGLQVGVGSISRGPVQGAQVAVVNVGGAVTGTQIGVVNVADTVDGAQIGVVNVANSSAAPIGLFNIVRDGYYSLQLYSSDLSPTNIGVKMGGRHVYTQLGFGLDRSWDDRTLMVAQAAVGVHFRTASDRFFVDADVGTTSMGTRTRWNEDGVLNTARLVVGYRLLRHLAITAGPTFNVHVHKQSERELPGLGIFENVIGSGEQRVRLFPGFVAGLQI